MGTGIGLQKAIVNPARDRRPPARRHRRSSRALAVLAVLADPLDRNHLLVLGGLEHDDALRRRPAMRMPSTGQRMSWPPSVTSMISSPWATGKGGDEIAVALVDGHRDDAFAAAPGDAVFVGRRALAEALFRDGEDDLLGG